jgi:hypothetical protein
LLINLHSRQLIPVHFMICINLVQLVQSNAICQSMKHAHNSSSINKDRSVIIHSIPITSLVSFLLLNAHWSPSTCSIFLWIRLLCVVTTIFAVYAIRLIVQWSLHFVAL